MSAPIICLGQQPCGFFPKRFLVAKFRTARRLQQEIGGQIVFFYHDSDHDPRETKTTLRQRNTHQPVQLNFEYENKLQRKFSPLYLKRVPREWRDHALRALPNYVTKPCVQAFADTTATTVAEFCLEMYQRLGLLEGFQIARSSNPSLRTSACDITDFFVDVQYESETVRARHDQGQLKLHEGGDKYLTLPPQPFTKAQVSPTRDSRLRWMQSVLHCTHYVCGAGEQQYLNTADAPDITYVKREDIENSDEAFTEF